MTLTPQEIEKAIEKLGIPPREAIKLKGMPKLLRAIVSLQSDLEAKPKEKIIYRDAPKKAKKPKTQPNSSIELYNPNTGEVIEVFTTTHDLAKKKGINRYRINMALIGEKSIHPVYKIRRCANHKRCKLCEKVKPEAEFNQRFREKGFSKNSYKLSICEDCK